ncbi:HIRAN domain-containing protein [Rothia sp. LK2588]|uniref:HIRAN domain-containing protein n=1 Tax=Rothia sp. LK2588 TaxID=3114369 RepID=UPI0034CDA5FC
MAKVETPRETHWLGSSQNIQVVGTSYRADKIKLMGNLRGKRVSLIPEPNNPYDPNAISVRRAGIKIGYLSQYWAKRYSPKIRTIFIAGYLPTATVSKADGLDIKISIDKPHEINLPFWITRPKKHYKIPKTYEVSGEFPILTKAPKQKKEKGKGKERKFFRFFRGRTKKKTEDLQVKSPSE